MDKMFELLSEERKELQAKGYYPEWVTTQGHQMFKQSYKYEDTYMLGRHQTIAKTLSSYLPVELQEEYEAKFFDLLWSGKLSPSTPVLANCGTERGFTVACSGQYIGDSVDDFYTGLRETALLSQAGFGTSGHFSDIRPRGSSISKGGTASGARVVIDDFFTCASKISQGGSRRGSFAAYIDIESDDYYECIQDLFVNTNGKNYGWIIKDSFIDKLVSGDKEANHRFVEALYNKQIHGKGYYFFLDKVNAHRPQMYKDLGLDIKASNLCVHGDTTILTDQGNLVIKDLVNQDVKVWNGKQWSNTKIVKTNTNQELINITLNTGESIKCTPYHKFYLLDVNGEATRLKFAHELAIEDDLITIDVINRTKQVSSIVSIESVEGLHDTYCFNEPLEHKGVFNGILTGNCSEIMLHSSEEYTYSCILSSLNLTKWDDMENDNTIFDATVFLDCVTSDFIAKSEGIPGLEKVRAFTIKGRAIGLGVMGLHTLMQSRSLPIDTLQSHLLDMSIFKRLHDESLRASQWLAETLGEPDWCKGYGVRNTHRTALAPTKSTALLMGGVSEGINPDPGMAFEMGSAVGELKRITPIFYELMKERSMYSKQTVSRIIANLGSVQQEDWLTDHEKQVFKTAFEINQEVLINRTSARQQFICQGQSLNLFVADEDMDAQVAYLISLIFLDPNILSQYYIYSRNGVVVNDECVMCSG